MIKNTLVVATVLLVGACNNKPNLTVDSNAIATAQRIALITCAIAPTAEQIAALYTNNPDVKTAEAAAQIACDVLAKASVPVVSK